MTRDHRLREGPRAKGAQEGLTAMVRIARLRYYIYTVIYSGPVRGGCRRMPGRRGRGGRRRGRLAVSPKTHARPGDLSHFREHAASESSNARFGCYTNTTRRHGSDTL